MGFPIIEQISQLIAAKLATVTEANGYNVTVAEVLRPIRLGVATMPANLTVIMLHGDPARDEEIEPAAGANGCVGWVQPFLVDLIVRPSDKDTVPVDQAIEYFRADIEKALMADPQWGGLAWDSRLMGAPHLRETDGTYDGVTVIYEVRYRVQETDPYTKLT